MTTKSLRELAAESTNATEESKGTPKKKSFASLLRGMNQDAKVVQKKGGPVKPATSVEVQAEIPELVRGLFYRDANGVACGYTNDKGVTACVFEDKFGIGGIKGAIYVHRSFAVITPAIAAYSKANFSGHNRNQTAPAVKRYKESMQRPDKDPNGWHFVGNTAGYVVAHVGDDITNGQCNAGHTFEACIQSGKTILMNMYFGIPEQYANLADVNIPRTPKDTIGRLHRFDKYLGISEMDGEPLTVTVTAADIKAMDNVHSQAIRIVACVQAGKKVKDSEPLGPSAIAELDAKYGNVLETCVLKVYLIDRAAQHDNGRGKSVPGALKARLSLSHAAAAMCILCAMGDDENGYTLSDDGMYDVESFYTTLVNESEEDANEPAVCLRNTLESFKLNKMPDQNIRWTVLKICLAAEAGEDVVYDQDTLEATTSDDKIVFGTPLDPVKSDDKSASELDEEEEV